MSTNLIWCPGDLCDTFHCTVHCYKVNKHNNQTPEEFSKHMSQY